MKSSDILNKNGLAYCKKVQSQSEAACIASISCSLVINNHAKSQIATYIPGKAKRSCLNDMGNFATIIDFNCHLATFLYH